MDWLQREEDATRSFTGNFAAPATVKERLAMVKALQERLQYDAVRIADLMEQKDNAVAELRLTQAELRAVPA